MLDIPTLETERLLLRPWRPEEDAAAVYAYASIEEVARYMLFVRHTSIADAEAFLENTKTSPEHGYAVTLRDGGQLIGGCGITPVPAHSKGEFGYVLHPDYWGRGLGTEIAKRLIRYGFEDLGLNRICARADTRNPASTRVMIKAGMTPEGTLREDMIVKGTARSFVLCSILRSEWAFEV
jgi:ribosomal-protein-alanine N-acetyltransferase